MGVAVETIGTLFCVIGGFLLLLGVLVFMGCIVTWIWQQASNEFRAVCKAESLIFEYKKEREEYLRWKKEKEE